MSVSASNQPQTHPQLSHIQASAAGLIPKLCDRSAYASDEEYTEILNLVRELRKFCDLRD